jgi:hypothetical protein
MSSRKGLKQGENNARKGESTGGNKTVTAASQGSVSIGGNVSGSIITVGNNNIVGLQVEQAFSPIYKAIENHPNLSAADKTDLNGETQDLEAELKKGDEADESFLTRRLHNIKRMAPEILEVILATITNPAAGFGLVAKKVADKMKASAG